MGAMESAETGAKKTKRVPISFHVALLCCVGLVSLEVASYLCRNDLSLSEMVIIDGMQVRQLGNDKTDDSHGNSTAHGAHDSVIAHVEGHESHTAHDSHGSAHDSHGSAHEEHESPAKPAIIFFAVCYFMSALAQQLCDAMPKKLRPPHSVVLFFLGMFMGGMAYTVPDTEFGSAMMGFVTCDPHIIFWVLLPALLYEDASSVHWHVIHRVLPNALLLAVPGVIMNTLLTGALIKGCFSSVEWPWASALLLGTILSATDPVAVVGALQALNAPEKLSSLISGESLFNDGSAVVLFFLFWEVAKGVKSFDFGYAIKFFIQMACGGPALGFGFALVAYVWLKKSHNFKVEILVIFITMYAAFFVAEHHAIHVSGVLAVVIFGFFMASIGHYAMDLEREHEYHAIVNFLALLSNEAIFVIAGMVGFRYSFHHVDDGIGLKDWGELILLYFIIHLTRTAVIAMCWPILTRNGYGLTIKEAVILLYGGLRGAVGLAMALLVEADELLEEPLRLRIAFHVSGIVLLTLVINGTTITMLYGWLEIQKKNKHHDKLMMKALEEVEEIASSHGELLAGHWFFHNCNFQAIERLVPDLREVVSIKAERISKKKTQAATRRASAAYLKNASATIHEVMIDIARKAGSEDASDRFMRKMRFCKSQKSSGLTHCTNIFLPVDGKKLTSQESPPSYSELLSEHGPSIKHLIPFVEGEDPVARARKNWMYACHAVKIVVEAWMTARFTLYRVQTPHRRSGSKLVPSNSAESIPTNGSSFCVKCAADVQCTQELYQTVINSAAAQYGEMFESRILGDAPYKILMESLDVAEEAVNGELKEYDFITSSGDPDLLQMFGQETVSLTLASVEKTVETVKNTVEHPIEKTVDTVEKTVETVKKTVETVEKTVEHPIETEKQARKREEENEIAKIMQQMQKSGTVMWLQIKSFIRKRLGFRWWFLRNVLRISDDDVSGYWPQLQWKLLKRDVEIILSFVLVHEHLLGELHVFKENADMYKELAKTVEKAKTEGLFHLTSSCNSMVILFEHILLARLILVRKQAVLEHLAKEGVLKQDDVHHVVKRIIEPHLQALDAFVPGPDQLALANFARSTSKLDKYLGESPDAVRQKEQDVIQSWTLRKSKSDSSVANVEEVEEMPKKEPLEEPAPDAFEIPEDKRDQWVSI